MKILYSWESSSVRDAFFKIYFSSVAVQNSLSNFGRGPNEEHLGVFLFWTALHEKMRLKSGQNSVERNH